MQKPVGWDDIKAVEGGPIARPQAGGYVLGVVRTEEAMSKGNKPMIVLHLDIARGNFKNHYRQLSQKFKSEFYLRYNIMTQEEKSLPFFKGAITAFEKSNQGYKWNWNVASLKGKLIGACLQDEEYQGNDGSIKTRLKVQYLCSIETIEKGVPVPSMKKIKIAGWDDTSNTNSATPPIEDDLPF